MTRFRTLTMGILFLLATFGFILPRPAPALTTFAAPGDYVVTPPGFFDGVAEIIVQAEQGTFGGSGSLLSGGSYILTAAHLFSGLGNISSITATFNNGLSVQGAQYIFSPGWDGNFIHGNDISILKLSSNVPFAGYQIYRDQSTIGVLADIAGYGFGGRGLTGYDSNTYPFGTLRQGENRMDTLWGDIPGNPFAFDFDDGSDAHDTLCHKAGVCDEGLGVNEVMISPGDSGGPSFINMQIAGVHSFGATFGPLTDINDKLDSSFGEVAGDTRVALFADWIDSVIAPVPEPIPMLLLGCGLAWLWAFRRKVTK